MGKRVLSGGERAETRCDGDQAMMPVLDETGHVEMIPVRQYFEEQKMAKERKARRNNGLKRF